jgi:hypothetical protein
MRILFCLVLGLLLVLSFRSVQRITQDVKSRERTADSSLNVQFETGKQEGLAARATERNVIGLLAGFSLLVFVMMNSKRSDLC